MRGYLGFLLKGLFELLAFLKSKKLEKTFGKYKIPFKITFWQEEIDGFPKDKKS